MKNELQPLRLFSPLFPHIYRKSEWGDLDNYREDLSAGEVLKYEDKILPSFRKKSCPARASVASPFTSMTISAERCTALTRLLRNETVSCGA